MGYAVLAPRSKSGSMYVARKSPEITPHPHWGSEPSKMATQYARKSVARFDEFNEIDFADHWVGRLRRRY